METAEAPENAPKAKPFDKPPMEEHDGCFGEYKATVPAGATEFAMTEGQVAGAARNPMDEACTRDPFVGPMLLDWKTILGSAGFDDTSVEVGGIGAACATFFTALADYCAADGAKSEPVRASLRKVYCVATDDPARVGLCKTDEGVWAYRVQLQPNGNQVDHLDAEQIKTYFDENF